MPFSCLALDYEKSKRNSAKHLTLEVAINAMQTAIQRANDKTKKKGNDIFFVISTLSLL